MDDDVQVLMPVRSAPSLPPPRVAGASGDPEVDVLIAGYGPVGAVLAALLGGRGLSVAVVEPRHEPTPLPRAVGVDEEILRLLVRLPGLAGLLDHVHAGGRQMILGPGRRVLLELGLGESDLGMPVAAFFHQPTFERDLRAGIATLPTVQVHRGRAVTALHQPPAAGRDNPAHHEDAVTVELDDGARLRARWVVGCDGASSPVRRMLGIGYGGTTFAQRWLVVDVATPAPLAHLPYFAFSCDPQRPSVTIPTPGGHRWEWMLLPDEDPQQMTTPASVRALLRPWVDPDQVQITRTAVFTFQARTADRWRQGHVLLAGDAAHSMPPFSGQGLGAGIRDAAALAWRLEEILRGLAGDDLLDGYERERRRHVETVIAGALRIGRLVQTTNPTLSRLTRTILFTLDRTPGLRQALRGGVTHQRPRLPGRIAGPLPGAGVVLPNPRLRTLDGHLRRLDDLLTDAWTLIGLGADPVAGLDPMARAWADRRAATTLAVVAPGDLHILAGVTCPALEDLDGTLIRLLTHSHPHHAGHASGLGHLGHLGRGRPGTGSAPRPPRVSATRVAVVRPDRFLLGVFSTPPRGIDLPGFADSPAAQTSPVPILLRSIR
ncbi:bifunctional 3-(3-hydroxy-phenyl)propionate/3-hydroxycinnamic acid hydroxylase [Frankia sp. AgPm24]|uniref:bifunctional 3-(3-hydroxy-phenyl)propionate/3-hydroxycinnamic acid hydroxylase n=1 Tax=Frankia sp. AgPm24 TaxID=631128 RepID=UPI00200C34D7|nr:bifunctional 3-(3-hydroxy-phenyl)propionate/3-hydroxycinnamic acid hydroxylase [Frankia sp. AgPm24]MCK9922010.1 bifunctional 3-(3-hydroxy-phenyl)propionate/3-hydroxycinnamic acid hydroxylase [Frankia sp. AgPm24]